jgi:hypothetical protein
MSMGGGGGGGGGEEVEPQFEEIEEWELKSAVLKVKAIRSTNWT